MCNIPKIIHQVWISPNGDDNIPDKWKKSPEMWKYHHPDWEYQLWTRDKSRNYIRDNYPEYLELYDGFPYLIQRCDMIRYFFLKDFGGIYSDLDLYPSENLEKYFMTNNEAYFVFSPNQSSFINCFMASQPNAKIWNRVIQGLKDKPPKYAIGKHLYVYYTTGPYLLNKSILEHTENITFLPRKLFQAYNLHLQTENGSSNYYIKDAVLHPLEGQSWVGWDTKVYNFLYRNQLLFASLGFIIIFIIIGLLIYYISKSKRIKNVCYKLCYIKNV